MEKDIYVCCHCGKSVSGHYLSPEGYYYLGISFNGCSPAPVNYNYRLCTDCFKIFKEVVGGFFVNEGE